MNNIVFDALLVAFGIIIGVYSTAFYLENKISTIKEVQIIYPPMYQQKERVEDRNKKRIYEF